MDISHGNDDQGHSREEEDFAAYHSNDPFNIPSKGPVERLKDWRVRFSS